MHRLFHHHWLVSCLKLAPSVVAVPKEWASGTCTFSLYVSQPFVLRAILINAYTGLVAGQGTLSVAVVVQQKDTLERKGRRPFSLIASASKPTHSLSRFSLPLY
jgi:hypothetical protein